ncbi:MAG: hypothetical protein WAQ33_06520 [Gaiellaceae bacterium]
MHELRMRGPVVTAPPAELLALEPEHRADEDRARLVQQPVRLRLAGTEWRGRIEAIDDAIAMQEQQPILRTTPRREKEQLQLIRGQQLLVVENECDLAVTLGQMGRQFEHTLRAHTQSPTRPA